MPNRHTSEWILLADKAHAKILSRESLDDALHPIVTRFDPGAQLQQHEQGADRPGRGHGSDTARHSYEDHADFPEQESVKFLRSITADLNEAAMHDKMDKIILVALPKTLAVIKSEMTEWAKTKIAAEYAKNLTNEDEHKLPDHLKKLSEQ